MLSMSFLSLLMILRHALPLRPPGTEAYYLNVSPSTLGGRVILKGILGSIGAARACSATTMR